MLPEQTRSAVKVERAALDRLFGRSGGHRWGLSRDEFADAVMAGVRRTFAEDQPSRKDLDRYLDNLHVADLALARACALGREAAWEHFVIEHRPVLYRAADAIDRTGGARELADSLYADLYGIGDSGGDRRSLFRYFHGRSSLATWLRAVLAQRHVDALRSHRRVEPLPTDDRAMPAAKVSLPDPDRPFLVGVIIAAVRSAIDRLSTKDRLRLRSYYTVELTLAEIGRMTGEHEATVSRHLSRTRRNLREAVVHHLREHAQLTDSQIARALELALEDPGGLDLQQVFDMASDGKEMPADRSK